MERTNPNINHWRITPEGVVAGTEYVPNVDGNFYLPSPVLTAYNAPNVPRWEWPATNAPIYKGPFDTDTPEAIQDDVFEAIKLSGVHVEEIAILLRHIAFLEQSLRQLIAE